MRERVTPHLMSDRRVRVVTASEFAEGLLKLKGRARNGSDEEG